MKDNDRAFELLRHAHELTIAAQKCEGFMRHVKIYTPQYNGLAYSAQRKLRTARMLLQAARMLHPATTLLASRKLRPVPPRTRPASVELHWCTTQEHAQRVALHDLRRLKCPIEVKPLTCEQFSAQGGWAKYCISESGLIDDRAWDDLYRGH